MGAFIADYDTPSERRKTNRPFDRWVLQRTMVFHKCFFTGKLIWPLTKAYQNLSLRVSERVTITEQDVSVWITPQAYTFRKLQSNSDA